MLNLFLFLKTLPLMNEHSLMFADPAWITCVKLKKIFASTVIIIELPVSAPLQDRLDAKSLPYIFRIHLNLTLMYVSRPGWELQ